MQKDELGWTAKIVVAEKTTPRSSTRSPVKYQSPILVDPEGNKIRAFIFDSAINAFQNKLQLTRTYLISNASVKEAKPKYRERNDELYWILNSRTIIQEVEENNATLLESTYNFTPFSDLQSHIDKVSDINILAAVIEIRPKRKIQTKSSTSSTIQEVVLMNDEFQTITLTMWDSFTDNECGTLSSIIHKKPIIACLQLRVVSHNGVINVQTKPITCFVVEPQFHSAKQLREWIIDNSSKLSDFITNKTYDSSSIPTRLPPVDHIIPISHVNDMLLMRSAFWVNGKVVVTNFKQSFWYTSCDKCHRSTGSTLYRLFECLFCDTPQAKAIPWPRVEVDVQDSSGSISATVFGAMAEQLFSCSVSDFLDATKKDCSRRAKGLSNCHRSVTV